MSESSTVVTSGQPVPALRSLRRRLWQALKDEDAATAIRAYTCSKADFEKWLAEEAAEEAQRLERIEEARQREKLEKREARPAALKKLGSLVSITKRGGSTVAGQNSNSHNRRGPAVRKTTSAATNAVTPTREMQRNYVENERVTDVNDRVRLLQLYLNPSEPFVPDDQKSPYASYDEPSQNPDAPSPTQRRLRKKSLVPRLAFFGRNNSHRKNDAGSDDGSDDGSDKNGVDETMTTPLHEACRIGCPELVRLMLDNGGEPNFRNGKNRTSLHMAAGGLTVAEEMFVLSTKGQMEQSRNAPETDSIGIRVPVIMNADESNAENHRQQSGLGATRAARAMGRFFKETLTSLGPSSSRDKAVFPLHEAHFSDKVDVNLVDRLQTDRMETAVAILAWSHPNDGSPAAGEGPSINSVDCRGRTALHYAAELGRTNVCMAVLEFFGAILTIVDDNALTPCELAADRSHKKLAAYLEARALLYVDPYAMEEEMLSAGFDEEREYEESTTGGGRTRKTLVPPFSWFETLTAEQVERERLGRITRIMKSLRDAVLDYNEAMDVRTLMYSHASEDDDDDFVGGNKAHPSKSRGNQAFSFPIAYENGKPSGEHVATTDKALLDHGSSHDRVTQAVSIDAFKEAHAELFLAHHGWNIEKCLNAIDDGPVKALADAGINLPSLSDKKQAAKGRTCLICCDGFEDNPSQWRNLENCEHGFCADCLGDFLRDCAVSRSGLVVVCPHHECSIHLSRNEIEGLSPEPEVYSALVASANDNFVAAASDLKFCPHPGCACVVKRVVPQVVKIGGIEDDILDYAGAVCTSIRFNETGNAGVTLTYEGVPDPTFSKSTGVVAPKKAHRFCFACGERTVHWPVPCETLKSWEKKIEDEVGAVDNGEQNGNEKFDDVAQRLWMKANTRPCPKVRASLSAVSEPLRSFCDSHR